jgi:hypothetical protein
VSIRTITVRGLTAPERHSMTDLRLPCGCVPESAHGKGCRMWRPGYSTAVYQCEAVVEMFEELNALWRLRFGVRA